MTDNSIYTQAEQIEALALVLQESMEHGGNLAPETYATVAAIIGDRAAIILNTLEGIKARPAGQQANMTA